MGLTSLYHLLSRRRISVFGHVARLDDDTPANMVFQLHINVSLNRPPGRTWRRPPGRHGTSGSTSYETIPHVRLATSGGVLSTVDMVVQRRDGPRRLRDDDDDDDDDDFACIARHACVAFGGHCNLVNSVNHNVG